MSTLFLYQWMKVKSWWNHVTPAISLAMHIRIRAHFQSLEHLGGELIISVNNGLNHHGAGWHRNIVVDERWFPANLQGHRSTLAESLQLLLCIFHQFHMISQHLFLMWGGNGWQLACSHLPIVNTTSLGIQEMGCRSKQSLLRCSWQLAVSCCSVESWPKKTFTGCV